jgi:hypothetical protein
MQAVTFNYWQLLTQTSTPVCRMYSGDRIIPNNSNFALHSESMGSLVLRKIGRTVSRDRKSEIQCRFDEFVRNLELFSSSVCAVQIRPFSLDSLKSTKNGKCH